MLKPKLRTALSRIQITRPLPPSNSSSISSSLSSIPPNQFSTTFSPSLQSVLQRYYYFFRNHQNMHCKNFSNESADKFRCWSCNSLAQNMTTTTPFLFCNSCRTVQPVDHSVDYFQIFGLEKNYEIGEENLEGKYKDWQKKLHPDLVYSKSEKEKEYAAEQSARVIDAYRTLTNPLSRAIYILKQEGVDVDEEERISDPELLAEIMEIREAVEEAEETPALNQIQGQVLEKLTRWSKSFANAFQSGKYEDALTSIRRMTYYKRANEEIIKKL